MVVQSLVLMKPMSFASSDEVDTLPVAMVSKARAT